MREKFILIFVSGISLFFFWGGAPYGPERWISWSVSLLKKGSFQKAADHRFIVLKGT